MGRLWHGGFAGLRKGEVLSAQHGARHFDGCALCAKRQAGTAVMDPLAVQEGRVYVTSDREYARYYASLAHYGDLYQVEPRGELIVSGEDRFPAWTCETAVVTAVYARAVQLTAQQRSALLRRWRQLDAHADGWGAKFDALSSADRRALHREEDRKLWRSARQIVEESKTAATGM